MCICMQIFLFQIQLNIQASCCLYNSVNDLYQRYKQNVFKMRLFFIFSKITFQSFLSQVSFRILKSCLIDNSGENAAIHRYKSIWNTHMYMLIYIYVYVYGIIVSWDYFTRFFKMLLFSFSCISNYSCIIWFALLISLQMLCFSHLNIFSQYMIFYMSI